MVENQPVTQEAAVSPTTSAYASFGKRFVAVVIDSIVIGIINFIIQIAIIITTGITSAGSTTNQDSPISLVLASIGVLVQLAVTYGYAIYFIGSRGQTLGKMAMNIKVVKLDTKKHPDFVSAFLREVVGKMLSAILLLGYLWMLWDDKKQTWHDKIAGTVVINV